MKHTFQVSPRVWNLSIRRKFLSSPTQKASETCQKTVFTFNFIPVSFLLFFFPFHLHSSSHSSHSKISLPFERRVQRSHPNISFGTYTLIETSMKEGKNENKTNIIHKLHFTHIIIMLFNIWCFETILKLNEGWQMESIKILREFQLLRRCSIWQHRF